VPITYLIGDATQPQGEGGKIIAHVCNTAGGWGRGFVVAISKRWREPEAAYRAWARGVSSKGVIGSGAFVLGSVQFVTVAPKLAVANMIAQKGYGPQGNDPHRTSNETGQPLVQYEGLGVCLMTVKHIADKLGASVHMPRIGCSLGGGSWSKVGPIIERVFNDRDVFVYDLPGSHFDFNP
jgi:O-acetyl-ADP-ribose deacetylase (regulator of RNase III)